MKNIFKNVALVLSVLSVSIMVGYAVLAWTEPGSTPPGGNIAAPVNTGANAQTKSGNFNILGNVGIGTTSPGAKLEINGQIKITGGNPAAGKVLVSDGNGLAAWTNAAQTKSCASGQSITAYNAATGAFTCGTGGGGSCSCDGKACGDDDGCGNTCQTGTCTAGTCTAGVCKCGITMASCTANSECCSGTCSSHFCTTYNPCVKDVLPAGAKRIFVTSATYKSSEFGDKLTAPKTKLDDLVFNQYCKSVAAGAGLKGNYRALVYFKYHTMSGWLTYDPTDALPASASFWSGKVNAGGDDCNWTKVASDAAAIFNASGISTAIASNETGAASTAAAWTNFKPKGSSSYDVLDHTADKGFCFCGDVGTEYFLYSVALSWIGKAGHKDITWAYKESRIENKSGPGAACTECLSQSRALYCVEQ